MAILTISESEGATDVEGQGRPAKKRRPVKKGKVSYMLAPFVSVNAELTLIIVALDPHQREEGRLEEEWSSSSTSPQERQQPGTYG